METTTKREKRTLLDVNEDYQKWEHISNKLEEAGGDLSVLTEEERNEIMSGLEDPGEEFADFVERYVYVYNRLQSEAKMIRDEEKRLQAHRKRRESSMERLKNMLDYSLRMRKLDEFETLRTKLSYRKSTSVEIDNEDSILRKYKTPQPPKIDKTAIGKDLRAGKTVRGASLIEKQNIQIK